MDSDFRKFGKLGRVSQEQDGFVVGGRLALYLNSGSEISLEMDPCD